MERGREGGREGGRVGGREGGREGGRFRGWQGKHKGGRKEQVAAGEGQMLVL